MEHILIRPYRQSDYKPCRALWGEFILSRMSTSQDSSFNYVDFGRNFYLFLIDPNIRQIWVAEYNNTVVALAGLMSFQKNNSITPVIISSVYRGTGIGTSIINHVIAKENIPK